MILLLSAQTFIECCQESKLSFVYSLKTIVGDFILLITNSEKSRGRGNLGSIPSFCICEEWWYTVGTTLRIGGS